MTIFVWDGVTLAADKAEYKYGALVNAKSEKIYQFTRKGVTCTMVCAGEVGDILALRDHINKEFDYGLPSVTEFTLLLYELYSAMVSTFAEFDCLLVLSDGTNKQGYYLGKQPFPVKVSAPYAGGHSDAVLVALGALHAGADAATAVRIAQQLSGISQVSDSLDVVQF